MGGGQYYGYALPSGYASATINGINPFYVPRVPRGYGALGKSFYSSNAQPIQTIHQAVYPQRSHVYPSAPHKSIYKNYYGQKPTYAAFNGNAIPVYQSSYKVAKPAQPAAAKVAAVAETASLVSKDSNLNDLKTDAENGFKLLDDLVQTVSEAAGTPKDSDSTEVDALKSLFPDIIDEIVNQVESKYDGSNGAAQKEIFLSQTRALKQLLNSATTQSYISSILKPYVASLKQFTSQGLQAIKS